MSKKLHTEADRALWLLYCISYASELIGLSVPDTAQILNECGLIAPTLNSYRAFHTQGYEYMAEMLIDELHKAQEVNR